MVGQIDEKQVEFVTILLHRAISETAEVCAQCGKCPSACPVSRHIEGFNPRQLVAKVSLGRVSELLKSDLIWTCTSCLKCKERCPEKISPYDVILILRTLAYKANYDHPSGYDDLIRAVIEKGVASEPQIVRTRDRGRLDRAHLGLPQAEKPKDMKKFTEILSSIVLEGVTI